MPLDRADRRKLHARLATIVAEPEERARHLAQSVDDASEAVAGELEAAAARARSRGASDAAAELLLQAAQRTPRGDAGGRHRRTLSAAEQFIRAGDPTHARSVLEDQLAITPAGRARSKALRILADARSSDDWEARYRLLTEALDTTGTTHGLRSRILQDLAWTMWDTARDAQDALGLAVDAVARRS